MIEEAPAVLGDVEIGPAISIVVSHGDTHAVAAAGNASGFRHISESSISIVTVKRVTQRRIWFEEIAFATVHQINVHPPVVVVVKKRAAGASSFGQVVVRGTAIFVPPCDAAGGRRDFFKERLQKCSRWTDGRDGDKARP